MTIWSLSVSPIKPNYSTNWFATVHEVIRTYSSKYICAEENGSNDHPTHVQAAFELDDDRKEAFNRALLRAIHDLPGRGDKTKVMRKNPNAFKYVSKEDGRKEYVGFTEDDLVELRRQYLDESGQAAGSNWPFFVLARKVAVLALDEYEDGYELLANPIVTIAATLLSDDLITQKEYNRMKNNSPIIRINLERMRRKWQDAVHAIRVEILAAETERIEALNVVQRNEQKVRQAEQRARWEANPKNAGKRYVNLAGGTNEEVVNPTIVEQMVATRVAELDPGLVL